MKFLPKKRLILCALYYLRMPYFAMKIDWLSQTAWTPDIEIGILQYGEKTAFIAFNWLCQCVNMPFGLCNALDLWTID